MGSLLLLAGLAHAQVSTLPPDEALRQIRTPRFIIVFPESAEAEAQQAATTLEQVAGPVSEGLGERPRRLTVVLNDQYTLSNGYVTLAPRRSSWWTTPIMEGDPTVFGTSLSWLDALAVHEYRHVVQLDHARVGATRAAYWLSGETGWLVGSSLALPPWFLEGDAVVTETALTRGGRGRTPAFLLDMRVELLEDDIPTFSQAVVGSFKETHPGHYPLGFALSSYGESHFDPELWSRVSEDAARWFFVPLGFSRQVRKEVGLTLPELHHLAMYELQQGWRAQMEARGTPLKPTDLSPVPRHGEVADYSAPRPQPDGSVIAYRSGNEDAGSIVRLLPDGREERLARVGVRPQQAIAAAGGRVIWDETRFHPRWDQKSWSVLRVLDTKTGLVRDLTARTRLFSPTLSPDGARVAAVELSRGGGQSLVVLDASTGQEIRRYPAPDGEILRSPSWVLDSGVEDGAVVLVRQDRRAGIALGRLELESGAWTQLTPWRHLVISEPSELGGRVFYSSGEAGAEDPWVLDRATGQTAQLGVARHGAYGPVPRPDGSALVYTDARRAGRAVVSIPLSPERTGDPSPTLAPLPTERWMAPIIEAASPPGGDVLAAPVDGSGPKTWTSKPYHRISQLLNVHSWLPKLSLGGDLGGTVMAADVTGSSASTLSVWYSAPEGVPGAELAFSWQASPVTVSLAAGLGGRSVSGAVSTGRDGFSLGQTSWRESSLGLTLGLPLQGGSGPWLRTAALAVGGQALVIDDIQNQGFDPAESSVGGPTGEGSLALAGLSLSLGQQTTSTEKEIAPRLYQSLDLGAGKLLPGSDASGWYTAAKLKIGAPGLGRMHRTSLTLGAERQQTRGYTFDSAGVYPRGYSFAEHRLLTVASLDYALPLLYPDLGAGGWVYLKRLRGDLFYDHGYARDLNRGENLRSVGAELVGDISLLRLPRTVGLGLRGAWLIDSGEPYVGPFLDGAF